MRILKWVLLAAVFGGVGFAAGVYTYHYRKPPYNLIRKLYRAGVQSAQYPEYESIHEDRWDENVASIISIRKPADVDSLRAALVDYVWKGNGLPVSDRFDEVAERIDDERFAGMAGLSRIDRYTLEMEYGVTSVIYHFLPDEPNGELVIYHQGHIGGFILGKKTIAFLIERGYAVLGMAMPLRGLNSQPVVDLGRRGRVRLFDHNGFEFLETPTFSCMRLYLDPVAVALNYTATHYDYRRTCMIGHSGGGATAILYAAIDPRIERSYPVNTAILPLFLRRHVGDYEKSWAPFYSIANTLELYIMGAYGEGRSQLQIWNLHDPRGLEGARTPAYRDRVREIVTSLGSGRFDVFLDPVNIRHTVGDEARRAILEDMER